MLSLLLFAQFTLQTKLDKNKGRIFIWADKLQDEENDFCDIERCVEQISSTWKTTIVGKRLNKMEYFGIGRFYCFIAHLMLQTKPDKHRALLLLFACLIHFYGSLISFK